MGFECLDDWLAWQSGLHTVSIDMGLDRIHAVSDRLMLAAPAPNVVLVGGTNGKGSTVALLESILLTSGMQVACYTSPHILDYRERVRINGASPAESAFCEAFSRIEAARDGTPLTYFEFGTLGAIDLISRANVDVAILEVGLGGRLDAVNILEPDVSLITSIGIDHVDWLGDDREAIGREKAGIMRLAKPVICADPEPPDSISQEVGRLGALGYFAGRDFHARILEDTWVWSWRDVSLQLPLPGLVGRHQIDNAAGAIMALYALGLADCQTSAIGSGIASCRLSGRFERRICQGIEVILDVCHNGHASLTLARQLRSDPPQGRSRMVFGVLDDKDLQALVAPLIPVIDTWYLAGIDEPRGLDATGLSRKLSGCARIREYNAFPGVDDAFLQAMEDALPGDRVVVTGSFYVVSTVSAALSVMTQSGTMASYE